MGQVVVISPILHLSSALPLAWATPANFAVPKDGFWGTQEVFVAAPEQPSHYAEKGPWFIAAASSIEALTANWDGYGAAPIPLHVIQQLKAVLSESLPKTAKMGSIVPGADGSLQAEWHLHGISVGFIVEEDKSVSTWVRVGDNDYEVCGVEAIGLLSGLASTLLNV